MKTDRSGRREAVHPRGWRSLDQAVGRTDLRLPDMEGALTCLNDSSRFQQREALAGGHPLPSFVRQVSALGRRDGCVPNFEDEWRQRRISESVVVIDGELTERFVAGDKFPMICDSGLNDWPDLDLGNDDSSEPKLKSCVHTVRVTPVCSVRSRRWRVTRKLRMLERLLPGEIRARISGIFSIVRLRRTP
jgi:hypothetical protein